jgi:E3 ubiquitin-protein ligase DOA10
MECRICLDDTQPLLNNLCACRGTQQYSHESCLRRWIATKRSATCEVCKEPFRIALTPVPKRPRMPWCPLLFRESTRRILQYTMLLFYFFPTYTAMLVFQQFLHILYSISYLAILPSVLEHHRYLRQWFRLVIVLPNQHMIFPLPSFFLYCLIAKVPFLGAIACFRGILRTHIGILQYLEHQDYIRE